MHAATTTHQELQRAQGMLATSAEALELRRRLQAASARETIRHMRTMLRHSAQLITPETVQAPVASWRAAVRTVGKSAARISSAVTAPIAPAAAPMAEPADLEKSSDARSDIDVGEAIAAVQKALAIRLNVACAQPGGARGGGFRADRTDASGDAPIDAFQDRADSIPSDIRLDALWAGGNPDAPDVDTSRRQDVGVKSESGRAGSLADKRVTSPQRRRVDDVPAVATADALPDAVAGADAPVDEQAAAEDDVAPVADDVLETRAAVAKTRIALAVAMLFLLIFNATGLKSWTYDLPDTPTSRVLVAAAEQWEIATTAMGVTAVKTTLGDVAAWARDLRAFEQRGFADADGFADAPFAEPAVFDEGLPGLPRASDPVAGDVLSADPFSVAPNADGHRGDGSHADGSNGVEGFVGDASRVGPTQNDGPVNEL